MLKKAELLPRSKTAHGETIAIELEKDNEILIATIEISDLYLHKFPSVSKGNIPENLFGEFVEKAITTQGITDGCIVRISSANTDDPSVDCMITVIKK